MNIKQLAGLCGVSTATVSLVLNNKCKGRVGVEKRKYILRTAAESGFRLDQAAKGLALGRAYRIVLAIEGKLTQYAIIGNFSFYERLGLLSMAMSENGYSIELAQLDMSQKASVLVEQLNRTGGDGVILMNWSTDPAEAVLTLLAELGKPAIACGTTLSVHSCSWSNVDRQDSINAAVRRLLGEGHRQIALINCGTIETYYSKLKIKAFSAAIKKELGIDAEDWIFHFPGSISHDEVVDLTKQAMRRMKGVSAFLLTDNFHADTVLNTIRQSGLRPGHDCRVVGFGETVLADRCKPRLSHYDLQIKAQVDFCVAALLETIENPARPPSHCLFKSRYVPRDT